MVRTSAVAAFYGVILVVSVPLVVRQPAMLAVFIGVAVFVVLFLVLDGWQRLWVALIVLLFLSTSNQVGLREDAYYIRYVVAVLLGTWTWLDGGKNARTLDDAGKAAARLIQGMWLAAGVAVLGILWSYDTGTTVLQAAALTSLAFLMHGLVTRRWQDHVKMTLDLGIAGLTFAILFTLGIIADAAGTLPAYTSGIPDTGRLRGYYDNPQALGITAALVFLTLFGVWRETKNRFYLLAMVPCGWSVLFSESRTGQVAIAAGLVWVATRDRARIKHLVQVFIIGILVGIATVSGVIPVSVLTSPFSRFTSDDGGNVLNTRNLAWAEALQQWAHQPFTGYGYGAGPALFRYLRENHLSTFDADVVHNSYLQWFLETGLIGLVPIGLLLMSCFAVVFKVQTRGLSAGLVATVFAGLLIQITESAMFGTGSNYPFLFWPVVAAGALSVPLRRDDDVLETTDSGGATLDRGNVGAAAGGVGLHDRREPA